MPVSTKVYVIVHSSPDEGHDPLGTHPVFTSREGALEALRKWTAEVNADPSIAVDHRFDPYIEVTGQDGGIEFHQGNWSILSVEEVRLNDLPRSPAWNEKEVAHGN